MPRMHSFGESFSVGSDDFFLPAGIGFFIRLFFVAFNVLFLVMVALNGSILEICEAGSFKEQTLFIALMGGFLIVSVGSLCIYAVMFYVATQGTPADTEGRDTKMATVLVAIVAVYGLEVVFAILMVWLCFVYPRAGDLDEVSFSDSCQTRVEQEFGVLMFCTVIMWLDLCAFMFGCWVFLHRYDVSKTKRMHLDSLDHSTVQWEVCIRLWCKIFHILSCNLFGFVGVSEESDEAYRSAAETFNTWFSNTDLTFTDLLVAFVLIHRDQKFERKAEERYKPHHDGRSSLINGAKGHKKYFNVLESSVRAFAPKDDDSGSDSDVDSMETGFSMPKTPTAEQQHDFEEHQRIFALHYEYIPYMIGMYGWKLMIYQNAIHMKPFTALHKMMRMPKLKTKVGLGHNDGCCHCDQNALLTETNIDPKDLLYASFGSVVGDSKKSIQVPHAIFLDHKKKSVVIAMRGTLSLSDLLVDAMIEPESLVEAGRMWGFDGKNHYAHHGMLKVALRIRRILERNKVLHTLFGVEPREYEYHDNSNTEGYEVLNVELDSLPDCRDYKLITLGHSLGAAAAAILTLTLRPTFPQAYCLAYAGPGATFSFEMAEQSKEWCSNIWIGNDIVTRLCWQTLAKLRLKVYDVLWRCKVNKAAVLHSMFIPWKNKVSDTLYEPYDVPDTPGRRFLKEKRQEFKNKRNIGKIEQIPMYQPGVLLHMAKMETIYKRSLCVFKKKRIFEPFVVKKRTGLDEPFISSRSLLDHFPHILPGVMDEIRQRYGMVGVNEGNRSIKRMPHMPFSKKSQKQKKPVVASPSSPCE